MPSHRLLCRIVIAVWLVCLAPLGRRLEAQDFRVYTAVTEFGPDAVNRRVVSRSLTIFHSGRVYDHMEQLGELVIFEPIHDRFVLIRNHMAAIVTFEELRQYLDVATRAADTCALELAGSRDPESVRLAARLKFQLRPEFEVAFSPAERRLRLTGSEVTYDVRGETAPSELILGQYLTYADWTARLNAVLHSRGNFPASRETLNRALKERTLLPVTVVLQAGDTEGQRLQASHEYRWQLNPIDKDQIHQWEQLRKSSQMQWVSFREYQQRLLAAAGRQTR